MRTINIFLGILLSFFLLSACGGGSSKVSGKEVLPVGNISSLEIRGCGQISLPVSCIDYKIYDEKKDYYNFVIEKQDFPDFKEYAFFKLRINTDFFGNDRLVIHANSTSKYFPEELAIEVFDGKEYFYSNVEGILLTNLKKNSDVFGSIEILVKVLKPSDHLWMINEKFTLFLDYQR